MDTSKQRPDLMAPSRVARERQHILANLEHGPKAMTQTGGPGKWQLDGWTIALGVLLVLLSAMAWMAQDNASASMTQHKHYDGESASIMQPPATPVDKAPSSAVAAVTAESKQAAQTVTVSGGLAAAIVNEAVVPERQAMHPIPSTPARPSTSWVAQHPAFNNAAHSEPRPVAAIAVSTNKPAPSAHKDAAPADTDVALLTALRAHDHQPSTVAPERSRDVVERQEGDSTAALLARCKQLGLIESMLCRSRICSGRWENDDACRAPER